MLCLPSVLQSLDTLLVWLRLVCQIFLYIFCMHGLDCPCKPAPPGPCGNLHVSTHMYTHTHLLYKNIIKLLCHQHEKKLGDDAAKMHRLGAIGCTETLFFELCKTTWNLFQFLACEFSHHYLSWI